MANKERQDISYEIVEHIGIIPSRTNGWDKELNLIRWNDADTPKFDIRSWSPRHDHMARGITLYADEMREIVQLYQNWKHNESVRMRQEEREASSRELRRRTERNESRTVTAVSSDMEDEDEALRGNEQAETSMEMQNSSATEVAEETQDIVVPDAMQAEAQQVDESVPF